MRRFASGLSEKSQETVVAEAIFSLVDKEALAITWACEKKIILLE